MGQSMCNPLQLIQGAGLRATKPRVAVLSYLASNRLPVGIQDIKKRMGKRIDLVTLYRMMDDFKKAGIVTQLHLGKGDLFELKGSYDHHHIVCTNCNRIEDFSDETHEKLAQYIVKKSRLFTHLTNHSFELFGLCNPCAKKESAY